MSDNDSPSFTIQDKDGNKHTIREADVREKLKINGRQNVFFSGVEFQDLTAEEQRQYAEEVVILAPDSPDLNALFPTPARSLWNKQGYDKLVAGNTEIILQALRSGGVSAKSLFPELYSKQLRLLASQTSDVGNEKVSQALSLIAANHRDQSALNAVLQSWRYLNSPTSAERNQTIALANKANELAAAQASVDAESNRAALASRLAARNEAFVNMVKAKTADEKRAAARARLLAEPARWPAPAVPAALHLATLSSAKAVARSVASTISAEAGRIKQSRPPEMTGGDVNLVLQVPQWRDVGNAVVAELQGALDQLAGKGSALSSSAIAGALREEARMWEAGGFGDDDDRTIDYRELEDELTAGVSAWRSVCANLDRLEPIARSLLGAENKTGIGRAKLLIGAEAQFIEGLAA